MKKLAVVLLVSFGSMSAIAANWVEVGSDKNKGIYFYVDTESVSTQGSYKQAFTKQLNIPGENYFIGLSLYDCKSNPRRTKPTYITQFNLTGNVTFSSEVTGQSFRPVLPESLGKAEADFICGYR